MPRIDFYRRTQGGGWYIKDYNGNAHYPDWNWSDDNSGITPGTRLKATHIQDLRNRTKDFRSKLIYCSCTCNCTCTCQCTCQHQCHCECTCQSQCPCELIWVLFL